MPSTAAPRVNFSRPGELDLLGSLREYGKMFPVFSLLPKKMFSGIFLNSSFPPFFLLMESTRAGFFPSGILGIVVLIYPPASGSSPSQQVSPGQSFTEGLFSCRTCGAQQFHLPCPGFKIQSPIHGCICRHGINDGAGISQALGSIQGCWFPPQLYLTTLQSAGDEPLPKAPGVWLCSPGFPAPPGQQETLWEAAELGADKCRKGTNLTLPKLSFRPLFLLTEDSRAGFVSLWHFGSCSSDFCAAAGCCPSQKCLQERW